MSKSKITKNFISFRQFIRTKDLSINEQYLLEFLFEFHNHKFGYAYPDLKTLMKAFNTTSKNRIVSTIKKLEKKGLIRVVRKFKDNNRYFIHGIENFITGAKGNLEEEEVTHKESQVVEETRSEKVQLIVTKFKEVILSKKHKEVIEKTDKKVLEAVIEGINVEKVNGNYLIEAIRRVKETSKNLVDGINPLKFNNFKAREYDYDSLEAKLLGWEKEEVEEEEFLGIGWLGT